MVDISDDIIAGEKYKGILAEVRKHKSIEDYKKMILASVKKSKEDIAAVPTRIDEVERNKPTEENWHQIFNDINEYKRQIIGIDNQISDSTVQLEEKIKGKPIGPIAKKGSYNPLVDCGGYNCRHSLDFISPTLAKKLRPELFK